MAPPTKARRTIGPVDPYKFDPTIDGFATEWTKTAGGGGSSAQPFDVELSGSGASMSAVVLPGTINGILPTNYDATFTPLDDTLVYFVTLSVTANDGEIASALLSFPTAAPAGIPTVLGEPPTTFDYLLGIVALGVWYRTLGPGSITAVGQEMFRIDKTAPAPGTLPYEIYYSWALSGN